MICPQCGKQASGNFCAECGVRLLKEPQAAEPAPQVGAPARTLPATTSAEASGPQAPSLASSQGAPSAFAPPVSQPAPTPLLARFGALCPVCRTGALAESDVKGLFHSKRELVCGDCGSVFVDHEGSPRRFELTATRNPAEGCWQHYKHQTLSEVEWRRIAQGGISDAELQDSDLAEAMTELCQGTVHLQPSSASPILLKVGEESLFVLPNISLHEPRSVTRGAYGGPSIRVAKGVSIRVGGFQAQSHEELKEIDSGTLVLTTKRLCFSGALRSLEIDLRKLISVDPYSNAVAIRRSGKEKTEFFFGLERHTYSFTVQGRRYTEPMSGLILKYAIEGLLAQGG
jgi:hypothetical protein